MISFVTLDDYKNHIIPLLRRQKQVMLQMISSIDVMIKLDKQLSLNSNNKLHLMCSPDPILWAAKRGYTIDSMNALDYAILHNQVSDHLCIYIMQNAETNDECKERLPNILKKLDITDAFVLHCKTNNLSIANQEPFQYAADNKLMTDKIILYCLQKSIKIFDKNPLEYALINAIFIDGLHPIVYALRKKLPINGIHPLEYWAEDRMELYNHNSIYLEISTHYMPYLALNNSRKYQAMMLEVEKFALKYNILCNNEHPIHFFAKLNLNLDNKTPKQWVDDLNDHRNIVKGYYTPRGSNISSSVLSV